MWRLFCHYFFLACLSFGIGVAPNKTGLSPPVDFLLTDPGRFLCWSSFVLCVGGVICGVCFVIIFSSPVFRSA